MRGNARTSSQAKVSQECPLCPTSPMPFLVLQLPPSLQEHLQAAKERATRLKELDKVQG